MPNLIVSTCGTSLLTNPNREKSKRLNELSNKKESELSIGEKQEIVACLELAWNRLEQSVSVNEFRNASAEINTILSFYRDQLADAARDQHLLLHTDTYEGEQTALKLKEWFELQGIRQVSLHCCEKLNTKSVRDFQEGVAKLARKLADEIPSWKCNGYTIIFQLSGGFKSFQGFMQTAGMFFADEIVYKFEGANEIISIPRMPLNLDNAVIDVVRKNLDICRQFERKGILTVEEAGSLDYELYVSRVDDMVELTPWGVLCWERAKDEVYSDGLLPSPHERIQFGPNVEKSAKRWCSSKEKMVLFNKSIDELAKFLDTNGKHNPDSFDLHDLKGEPKPPSTHEFYVRKGNPAIRAYLHKESNNVWVIDQIGDHL